MKRLSSELEHHPGVFLSCGISCLFSRVYKACATLFLSPDAELWDSSSPGDRLPGASDYVLPWLSCRSTTLHFTKSVLLSGISIWFSLDEKEINILQNNKCYLRSIFYLSSALPFPFHLPSPFLYSSFSSFLHSSPSLLPTLHSFLSQMNTSFISNLMWAPMLSWRASFKLE